MRGYTHISNSSNYITICVYIYTYRHTVCVYTCSHVCEYIHIQLYMYIHTCMYDTPIYLAIYPHAYRYIYACVYVSLLGKHGISVIASVIPMRRTEPILNTNVIFLLFVGGHAVFVYACKAVSVARLSTFLQNPMTL